MSQKTVVAVDMLCSKCKKKVLKLVAQVQGIDSVVLNSSKGQVTTIGDADPAEILKKLRKFRCSAAFVSIGPAKEEKDDKDKKKDDKDKKKDDKDKKKDDSLPTTCHKCDVWYVIREDDYNYCCIL